MPSSVHNVVVELLEAHPEALEYLLTLHGTPPGGKLVPTTGTRTRTFTIERRVDRAYLVGSRRAPRSFALAEVQLDIDHDKRFSWALYVELCRSRYRCEGGLVVLTFSERVRRWIEEVVVPSTGAHGSSRQMKPAVLAVDTIAPDLLLRSDMPYLAQLAVAGHAHTLDAPVIAERAVDLTLERLPTHLASEQLDAILGMVDGALRKYLEERIMEHREYKSELFQGIYDKGEATGEAKGKAESILLVLSARGILISDALQQKILACTSVDTLDLWLRRAAVASTAAAVVRAEAAKRGPAPRASAKRPASRLRKTPV